MRIAIDLQPCQSGSRLRGIGRYAMAMTKAMLRLGAGHEFRIVLSERFAATIWPVRQALDGLIAPEHILVFHAPAGVAGADPACAWRCRAAEALREHFLAGLAPDIVFTPSLFEGFWDDSISSVGRQPVPAAVAIHDLIPLAWPEDYVVAPQERAFYNRKLISLKRADVCLAVSEHARDEACALLGLSPERVVVTSEAVEPTFRPLALGADAERALRDRFGLDRPFVMFTGSVEKRKNVDGLIRAFGRLPAAVRAGRQIAVVGAVEDHHRDHLIRTAAEAGLAVDDVVLTGWVDDEHLVGLYNLCRVFAFPSLHEGFGLPALEAMACGAAVIGSSTTSIPEVIGRADALFDPAHDAAIAARLEQALTDDGYHASLKAHGRARAAGFSWDASAGRALAAFEAVHARRADEAAARWTGARPRPSLALATALPPSAAPGAERIVSLAPELAAHYELTLVCNQPGWEARGLLSGIRVRGPDWLHRNATGLDRIAYALDHDAGWMLGLMADHPGVALLDDLPEAPEGGHAAAAARLGEMVGVVALCDLALSRFRKLVGGDADAWRRAPASAAPAAMAEGLAQTIEALFTLGPQARMRRLGADVLTEDPTPPSEADLAAVARALAANLRPPGRARLFIDVTRLAEPAADSAAGRTGRALVGALACGAELDWRIEPVRLEDGRYRLARAFTYAALDRRSPPAGDAPAQAFAGDVLVTLGLPGADAHAALAGWRDLGLRLALAATGGAAFDVAGAVSTLGPAIAAWLASPSRAGGRHIALADGLVLEALTIPTVPRRDYVVRGHVLGDYSLARINRAVARALERRHPGRAALAPVENGPVESLAGVPVEERAEATALAARLAPATRSRVLISQHYPILPAPPDRLGLALALTPWEESLAPAAMTDELSRYDAILAPSRYTAAALVDSGVRAPVVAIGQPADIAPFAALARRPRPPGAPFVFLHVSSALPRKGVDVLLAAWASAFRRADAVRLVIKTAPNAHNDAAARVRALRAADPDIAEIELIEADYGPEGMLRLFEHADALVSPSRGEGYNLPVIEAMAAGLPVIATDHGGHLDFCGTGEARLVRRRMARSASHVTSPHSLWAEPDADDLAAALREAVDPAERPATDARVARARAAALAAADPDAWADRLEALVRHLAAPAPSGPPRIAWISTWDLACGIAEYSRRLVERFSPTQRARLTVLADQRAPDLRAADGMRTEAASERVWPFGEPGAWRAMAEAVGRLSPDALVIQHQDGLLPWDELAALVVDARLSAAVTVVVLHNAAKLRLAADTERERLVRALAGADRVVVHTLADVNLLLDLGLTQNVTLLPHGAEPPGAAPPVRELTPRGAPVVGCHGFFLPGKGIEALVVACAALRSRWPWLSLRLVNARFPGDVSDALIERCRALAHRCGAADMIDWRTEFLAPDAIGEALGGCDLIVMPYEERTDSASGAVRTALSSLAPVMATRVGIFAELGDAAAPLASSEPAVIAAAIDRLLRDAGARRETQDRARAWLATHDWGEIAPRFEAMIQGLVAQRRAERAVAGSTPAAERGAGASNEDSASESETDDASAA